MSKIAAEAAREINREIANNTANYDFLADEEIAAIIERALSQSLAARDAALERLIADWNAETDTELCSVSEMCKILADELLALLKGKAI